MPDFDPWAGLGDGPQHLYPHDATTLEYPGSEVQTCGYIIGPPPKGKVVSVRCDARPTWLWRLRGFYTSGIYLCREHGEEVLKARQNRAV